MDSARSPPIGTPARPGVHRTPSRTPSRSQSSATDARRVTSIGSYLESGAESEVEQGEGEGYQVDEGGSFRDRSTARRRTGSVATVAGRVRGRSMRSHSRPRHDSQEDQDTAGDSGITLGPGDDEVERRDRGEELVRMRMRERKRAKKEQERTAERQQLLQQIRRSSSSSRPTSGSLEVEYDASGPGTPTITRHEVFADKTSSLAFRSDTEPGDGEHDEATYGTEDGDDLSTERGFDEDEQDHGSLNAATAGLGAEQHDGEDDELDPAEGDEVEYTLKDRQDAINIEHPFGLPIWKPALYKKSRSVTVAAETALHSTPSSDVLRHLAFPNLVWTLLFGWELAVICTAVAAVLWCCPWGGGKYGRVVWELGGYLLWPFGKYVEGSVNPDELETRHDDSRTSSAGPSYLGYDIEDRGQTFGRARGRSVAGDLHATTEHNDPLSERQSLVGQVQAQYGSNGQSTADVRPTSGLNDVDGRTYGTLTDAVSHQTPHGSGFRPRAFGRIMYWITFYMLVAPVMLFVCILCWGIVFTVPMAKLLWVLLQHLSHEPLSLHFRSPPKYTSPSASQDTQLDSAASSQETRGTVPQGTRAGVQYPLRPGQPAPRVSRQSVATAKAQGRLFGTNSTVLLCTYRAAGLQYYKYTVDGVNILFINLLSIVFFVIADFFFLAPWVEHHGAGGFLTFVSSQACMFVLALLAVIPLSYFIGMAVASISAQSSIGMGAVINASFGSVIEIILYCIALTQAKAELVEGSIVGSLLAGVLLMPGLSMIGGAMRRKEQKFNAKSAGVTSTMLIMAIIGILTPTLFYEIYGSFQLTCSGCTPDPTGATSSCRACYYEHIDPVDDPFYKGSVKYLSYYCAVILVLSYLIGLWFSLRTHASQIWQNAQPLQHHDLVPGRPVTILLPHDHAPASLRGKRNSAAPFSPHHLVAVPGSSTPASEPMHLVGSGIEDSPSRLEAGAHGAAVKGLPPLVRQPSHARATSTGVLGDIQDSKEANDAQGGHDAPNWSRVKSASVLMGCTVLYAVIAEILVDVVDVVLKGSSIPEKLLGVTLFALVPNTTEFMNAISFAINGNIALSMEIGSAYALQVCLIQAPAMLAFSAYYSIGKTSMEHRAFTLVFPRWDVIAIVFAVFLLTYVYIEARANYYRGSILCLAYFALLGGFAFAPGRGGPQGTFVGDFFN